MYYPGQINTRDLTIHDLANMGNFSHLSQDEYQEILKKSQNLSYNEHLEILAKLREQKQKVQNMKYKIFNVKDLLAEIQYEGVRKGTKTEAYLEDVIKSINKTKKYRWVQFFQLVDVFYIVVEVLDSKTKNATEEIKDHYQNVEPTVTAEKVVEQVTEAANQAAGVVLSKPISLKTEMPWKK